MQHSESGGYYEKLEILLDGNATAVIRDEILTGSDDFLAILCLAPPIEKNAQGRFVRWKIGSDQSSSLNFEEMGLVSLDMWDDPTVQTESVLFALQEDIKIWQNADPSKLPYEIIPIAASREYLLDSDETKEPFTCMGVNAWVYDDGSGEQFLYLSCEPFWPIWFAGHSRIGRLRQVVEYEIFNQYGIKVRSGECEVSEVYIGTPYNPTNAPYSIGFEEELIDEEVYIQTLAPGEYTVRLRVRVDQVDYTVVYKNGKGYRQDMHDFYWEEGEMSFETDFDRYVYARLNGGEDDYTFYIS